MFWNECVSPVDKICSGKFKWLLWILILQENKHLHKYQLWSFIAKFLSSQLSFKNTLSNFLVMLHHSKNFRELR